MVIGVNQVLASIRQTFTILNYKSIGVIIAIIALGIGSMITLSWDLGEDEGLKSASRRYRIAAVQSDDKICSQIGMDIMVGKGGSAVDVAIATMLCIGVTIFQTAGIGGGHFMTVYDKQKGTAKKTVKTLLARAVFPLEDGRDYYTNHSSLFGGTAVGVPGMIHGLYTGWSLYGQVPWSQLVYPSVKLCEGGFRVSRSLAKAIERRKDHAVMTNNTNLRNIVMKPDGSPKKEGDVMKRPKLARTLRIIAEDPLSFYNGSLAEEIIADLQEAGGMMEKDHLSQFQTRVKEPISGKLKSLNLTMYSPEPPSSGIVVQFILRILDGYCFDSSSLKDTFTATETYHKLIESFKFGFSHRSFLGDAQFWNASEVIKNMTDDEHIDSIRSKIDIHQTRELDYYGHSYEIAEDAGTAHLSVLTPSGAAVAMTASINDAFGSGVYGSRTGILFNNMMDDFSTGQRNYYRVQTSPSNLPEHLKMPMSSMSPTIFLTDDGQVAYILGASGGTRIISSMVYVAVHNLYFKMELGAATDRPRLHHQLLPHFIMFESGFDEDILEGLQQRNHSVSMVRTKGAVGSLVNECKIYSTDDGYNQTCLHTVSDGREGGEPWGY